MSLRNDVSPETLSVSLQPEGVYVEYLDGRSVFYHGVPQATTGPVRTGPGKDVHVLVTDPTETEGVVVYVNDRKTADEILADTGVGRVVLEANEETTLFPGVDVSIGDYRVEVDADPEVARGRVFVFAEDELSEQSWEIVLPSSDRLDRRTSEADRDRPTDPEADGDPGPPDSVDEDGDDGRTTWG
jgi:hypothetical protein